MTSDAGTRQSGSEAARERWQRLEALVDVALELPESEREAYIHSASDDPELRRAAIRLMEDGERRDPFAYISLAELASSLVPGEDAIHAGPPARVGAYRLGRRLGEGGMGAVYLADRDDGHVRHTVALKLVRRGLHHDPHIVRRFREERQTLALLEHPSIARFIDGGLTEDGVPFFAMEYVDGSPVDGYCDQRKLTVRQRLEIFVRACEAVAYAHERGIVHRDLKPSNLLVATDGTPKLLDFGIAKLVSPDDEASTLTRTGERLLTPEYASPEQLRGDGVTAASDVFALGVLLYELLTGRRPFRRRSRTLHDPREEPTRPSTAVARLGTGGAESAERASNTRGTTPARLKQQLRGDLDAIVLTALRREPNRRYATAAEFAADIRRHLEGRPVLARGDGWLYRSRRLVMRHRAALVAALLAVVVTTAVLALLRRDGAPPLIPGSAQRLTFDAALDLDPAISPDGARMAYVSDAEDFPRLYVTDLSTGTSEPLTGDFPLPQRSPRWSPDGSIISFQSGVRLCSVPSGGGVPEILVEPPPNEWVAYHAWSPDGSELVYVKMYELHVRSSAGGDSRAVTGPLPDPHSPAWSPDGRWIAFVSGNSAFVFGASERPGGVNLGNVGPSSIWLVPASGGDPIRVTDDASLNTSPAWLPSGRSLLFVSSRGGDRDVYRIDLAADGTPVGEPVRVTAGLGAHGISVSGDGTRLAYSAFRNSSNVWSAPLRAGGTARPVTSGTQSIEGLALSPDGRSLAFDSDRGGNQDIYTVSLNGGAPVRMTTSRADDFMPHWSPDGREIAYHTFVPGATRRLHVLNLADGTVTEVADAAGDQRFPGWSPDGRSLLYESVDGGLWSLYRVSRDDEGRWQQPVMLTTQAGAARWSPDGRSIVYRGSEGLWVAAADHGERRLVVAVDSTATDELGNVEWTPDGRRLIYKRIGAGALVSFWSVPASGGTPRLLLDLSDQRFASPRPELATDGERVYFTVAARESDVWVMELTGANR